MGEFVHLQTKSGPLRGYVVGKGPGILVLPSWWGLNAFFIELCDRLAKEGFTALGMDYYDGKTASTIPQAEKLRMGLDRGQMEKQLVEAFDWLIAKTKGEAAVMGFSLGSRFAYGVLRARHAQLKGLISFYGIGGGLYPGVKTPVLAHYAETDEYGAHAQAAKKMLARLQKDGAKVQSFTYPGTKHWFFEADRAEYEKNAAGDAWTQSVDFLKKNFTQL